MKQEKYKGFTLIELLVVISIIGILSSFAVVSLNSARAKARDALRKADMVQIRTAIMLYYDENNSYPICGGISWDAGRQDFGAAATQPFADCYKITLSASLVAGSKPYISQMPKDPLNSSNSQTVNGTYFYRYISNSDGTEYALVYQIEGSSDLQVIRGW